MIGLQKNECLNEFNEHIRQSLLDFILHALFGLFIKNHFSKIKNDKLPFI